LIAVLGTVLVIGIAIGNQGFRAWLLALIGME